MLVQTFKHSCDVFKAVMLNMTDQDWNLIVRLLGEHFFHDMTEPPSPTAILNG